MAHVIDFKEAGFDSVLDELEWRGLISQSTDRDRLAEALNGEPVSYYCGFDPTAASLHIGNLVQLIKDTVARRLNSEEGISFTEFSYQVLQGNDFLHLFDEYHCVLEIGGSDQWGNLTSGLDLIHKVRGVDVNVFTSRRQRRMA